MFIQPPPARAKRVRALTRTANGTRKRTGQKASAPLAEASGGLASCRRKTPNRAHTP
jgi:hypothetical protein